MMMNNNTIIIKFQGRIEDFDGYEQECTWSIPTYPQEIIKNLLIKFYQISGLKEQKYITELHRKPEIWFQNIFQAGLSHNYEVKIYKNDKSFFSDRCEEAYKIPNYSIDKNKDFKIFIKFIKSNTISNYRYNIDLKGLLKLTLLNEISLKIHPNYLEQLKFVSQDMYFILKILNQSNNCDLKQTQDTIKKVLGEKYGSNILCFSNYVDEVINSQTINLSMKYLNQNTLYEINDIKIRLGKFSNLINIFERKIQESLRNSVFEFSIVSLVIIERNDFDNFEKERNGCPNREERILYHGTQIHPISSILTGMFERSTFYTQFGRGVYFTGDLDYCWFYGGDKDKRANKNKIPDIGEIFTAIACLVYNDKTKFKKVNDCFDRVQPGKNEINFAYADSNFVTINDTNTHKYYGTEYVVWELEQICPLISLKFQREEYCIIWRDINFSKKAIYGKEFDLMFKDFLKSCIKYIKQEAKFNVYPCETTDEALKLVNKKKYNKIILISNVGEDLAGRDFVNEARKIIGNDVIVLFLAYNINHVKWIKNYKNALFSNNEIFYKEYLNCFTQSHPENKINQLIQYCQNLYHVKFNFDNNYLVFPHYRNSGLFSDLSF